MNEICSKRRRKQTSTAQTPEARIEKAPDPMNLQLQQQNTTTQIHHPASEPSSCSCLGEKRKIAENENENEHESSSSEGRRRWQQQQQQQLQKRRQQMIYHQHHHPSTEHLIPPKVPRMDGIDVEISSFESCFAESSGSEPGLCFTSTPNSTSTPTPHSNASPNSTHASSPNSTQTLSSPKTNEQTMRLKWKCIAAILEEDQGKNLKQRGDDFLSVWRQDDDGYGDENGNDGSGNCMYTDLLLYLSSGVVPDYLDPGDLQKRQQDELWW